MPAERTTFGPQTTYLELLSYLTIHTVTHCIVSHALICHNISMTPVWSHVLYTDSTDI